MSRKNGSRNATPSNSPLTGESKTARVLNVELAEDDVRLLINVIQATPVQGNLQSLPQMIARLKGLQEKLVKAISAPPVTS